jgi:hypothetical protein
MPKLTVPSHTVKSHFKLTLKEAEGERLATEEEKREKGRVLKSTIFQDIRRRSAE